MFGDTCLFNRMGQDSTTLNCYMGAVYDFLYCGLGSAEEFDQIDVEGKIAFIKRGTVTFSDKIANATAAGAAGIILYNNTAGMLNLTLTSTIPFGLMSGADGDFLAEGLELGDSFTGEIIAGAAYMALTPAESSSWGTTADLKMKPEIMAPGQNINSAAGARKRPGDRVVMAGVAVKNDGDFFDFRHALPPKQALPPAARAGGKM